MHLKKLLVSLSLLIQYGNVSPQYWQWAVQDGGQLHDYAYDLASDFSGNLYVTGYFDSASTFGFTQLVATDSSDVFLAKYDPSGQLLWVKSGGGTGFDAAYGVTADLTGNVYITGTFQNTAWFDGFSIIAKGNQDIFLAKYDASGTVLWIKGFGGTSGYSDGSDVTVGPDNDVLVAGKFSYNVQFDSYTFTTVGTYDIFLAKVDSSGTVRWALQEGDNIYNDWCNSVVVDPWGYCYITGTFALQATFGSVTLTAPFADLFFAKYSPDGNFLWVKQEGGTSGWNIGYETVSDNAGGIFLTGSYMGSALFGSYTMPSGGNFDVCVVKYDTSGTILWAKPVTGPSADVGLAVAADYNGNVYVTGSFGESATFHNSVTIYNTGGEFDQDIFAAKYDASGNIVWLEKAGSKTPDQGRGIVAAPGGNTYVAGMFSNGWNADTSYFGSSSVVSAGQTDVYLAALGNSITSSYQKSFEKNRFDLFPNPCPGIFTLHYAFSGEKQSLVRIYDVLGNEVYSGWITGSSQLFNLSSRPSGTYFINIITDGNLESGILQLTR